MTLEHLAIAIAQWPKHFRPEHNTWWPMLTIWRPAQASQNSALECLLVPGDGQGRHMAALISLQIPFCRSHTHQHHLYPHS